ncbi:hypothetical protein [Acaryochloris marina]|uniref:hypothetical protein n=1 Tax=Acaryochloris marina TaxID=155978 RepID=UPI0021C2D2F7|nr:hypothetical protein [Acaryochloris marina]BDM83176.1 hypothetical protein AM10699_60370 [Acaryochloris marina MBIC10699]
MTFFDRLERRSLNLQPILTLLNTGICGALLLVIVGQGFNINGLRRQVETLEARPVVVQAGQNQELVNVEAVDPRNNMRNFVEESLPLLFLLSKRVPEEIIPGGLDEGIDLHDIGRIPSIVHASSFILSSEYQPTFLAGIPNLMPEDYEHGGSKVLRVNRTATPKPVKDEPGHWRIYTQATLYQFDAQQKPVQARTFNRDVYVRPVSPPKSSATLTPVQALINATRNRGYEIYDIAVNPTEVARHAQ